MAYDPTPLDKGFASTAGLGAEGSMSRQGAYQPRVMDPASGRQMQKGNPVENAGPTQPIPRVKDPLSRQPMEKGKPVPEAYSGTFNQKVGEGLRAAGQTVKDTFFNPAKGAARNRGAKGR